MSDLILDNYVIEEPIQTILTRLRYQLNNGKLKDIYNKGIDIVCTCPNHKGGRENHPSCFVYNNKNDKDIVYGTAHCFTCGESWSLPKFVSLCSDGLLDGKQWLIDNFGVLLDEREITLEEININKKQEVYLDESILDTFESYHPYMSKRKLTPEVCSHFKIKYDDKSQSIVFPVWDIKGRLKFLTRRSVNNKLFYIDKNADKEHNIYLLNEIVSNDYKTVAVCESQLDALRLWCMGIPSIALFGAGTTDVQMETLNKTGVRHWLLCYDPDEAGEKGRNRFKRLVRKDVFVDDIYLPNGKDINDLTDQEVINYFSAYFVK